MPKSSSFRVISFTDGYVCATDVRCLDWCGHVHGDALEALVCVSEHRAALPPTTWMDAYQVFRGQLVEHADGRREVQAIQRSHHELDQTEFVDLEERVPGYQAGLFAPGPGGKIHTRAVYERNAALLAADVRRRGKDGLSHVWSSHYDAKGRCFGDLAQLERTNAQEARRAMQRAARRSSSRARQAA